MTVDEFFAVFQEAKDTGDWTVVKSAALYASQNQEFIHDIMRDQRLGVVYDVMSMKREAMGLKPLKATARAFAAEHSEAMARDLQ